MYSYSTLDCLLKCIRKENKKDPFLMYWRIRKVIDDFYINQKIESKKLVMRYKSLKRYVYGYDNIKFTGSAQCVSQFFVYAFGGTHTGNAGSVCRNNRSSFRNLDFIIPDNHSIIFIQWIGKEHCGFNYAGRTFLLCLL